MDLFDDIYEKADVYIRANRHKLANPKVSISFPQKPHFKYSFPYERQSKVPFEERFKGEFFLFIAIYEEEPDENDDWYAPTENLFIEYRINLLKDEASINQYWHDYTEYLKSRMKKPESKSTAPEENQPTKKKPKKIPQSLKECFQSDEDYTKVMGILADKGYIDPENFRWKNKMDKNWKGTICAFLRDFETKGYFKDHIKMNWPIAQAIAKNDFCVKIGGNKTYYSTNLLPAQTAIIPYCNKE